MLYKATRGKSLLVLNQGAHLYIIESFNSSMDQFIINFNSIVHQGDIVVFRSTVPGQKDCFNKSLQISPQGMPHEKFLEHFSTTTHDWISFDAYNAIASKKLKSIKGGTTHCLNVYNMIVLRFDGHVAAQDCLHYACPRAMDFWNQLLFANLAGMAKITGAGSR